MKTPTTFAALGLALARCFTAGAAEPASGVLQPTFQADNTSIEAGKAFIVRVDACAHPMLVTVLSLLGPHGGLATQIRADELAAHVHDITVEPVEQPGRRTAMSALSITPPSAAPCCAGVAASAAGDFAAFEAPESLAHFALPLATRAPAPGELLHVLVPQGAGRTMRMRHPVVVQGTAAGYLLYEFVPANLVLETANGAPVLNEAGEVVAIHVGREDAKDGLRRGVGNPVRRWLEPLRQQCAARE